MIGGDVPLSHGQGTSLFDEIAHKFKKLSGSFKTDA